MQTAGGSSNGAYRTLDVDGVMKQLAEGTGSCLSDLCQVQRNVEIVPYDSRWP